MEKLFEKLMDMGMEQFADGTREELVLSDKDYLKDIEDEKMLERRYEELDLSQNQRMFLNDYISCMRTAQRATTFVVAYRYILCGRYKRCHKNVYVSGFAEGGADSRVEKRVIGLYLSDGS